MNLSDLASKQKKLQIFSEMLTKAESFPKQSKDKAFLLLSEYRMTLAKAWALNSIDQALISDLDRRVEQIIEELRLHVGCDTPLYKEKTFVDR
jgi:hypothetical protein